MVLIQPAFGAGRRMSLRHTGPGCLAQADTLEDLAEAVREAVRDDFAEPGLMTEETARGLAAIQGTATIPDGPYPLRYDYQPPPSWTEADEDE